MFPDITPVVSAPARLAALRMAALMDNPAEESFDRLARLAAHALDVPVALCSVFDDQQHVFKGAFGLPESQACCRERPLSQAFCQYAAAQGYPLIIEDATRDPRVREHPATLEYGIRGYMGIPLITSDGHPFGTFCVIDNTRPRSWTPEQIRMAVDLAAAAITEIEMRLRAAEARQLATEAQAARAEAESLAVRNGELYRQALEGARLRERLVSLVTHDMKNPLRALLMSVQQIERMMATANAGKVPALLDQIRQSAQKMHDLLNDMLDSARLQAGQPIDLNMRPVDLIELIRRTVDESRRAVGTERIMIEPPDTAISIACDQARIERVIANLLSNAIKYSSDSQKIIVRVRQRAENHGSWAVVEVEDHGVGIPAEDMPKLFSWFHRGRNVADYIEGSGIGLAGSRLVVEQHGGTLTASSTEGAGCILTLRLPALASDESAQHRTLEASNTTARSG